MRQTVESSPSSPYNPSKELHLNPSGMENVFLLLLLHALCLHDAFDLLIQYV